MSWFIAYIVSVLFFHLIFNSILPSAFVHTSAYTALLLSSPFIALIALGLLITVLEKKGIIKLPPPKEKKPDCNEELEEAKLLENRCKGEAVARATSDSPESRKGEATSDSVHEPSDSPEPRQPTIDEMLHTVDLLDGHAFEKWCAQLLGKIGFSEIRMTKTSGDQGVDIVAVKDDIRYAIQCKCYSSDLGNHPIQEVHAGKDMYGCHVGVVMTNRYFTVGAKELAKATGTLLWDRNKIITMLQKLMNPET